MSERVAGLPPEASQPKTDGYKAWYGPEILASGGYHDGSVLANRLGLQFARIATLNLSWRLRKRAVDADLRPYVDAFERDGVVAIENFFPDDVFAQVKAECDTCHQAGLFTSEVVEDNFIIEEHLAVKRHKHEMPVAWERLRSDDRLKRLAAAVLRTPAIEKMRMDVNFMTKSSGAPPPSRLVGTNYLHADVHYPSSKAWLYLNDIDETNGAIVFAKGSTRLSLGRLAHEYDVSVRVARAKDEGLGYRTTVPGCLVRLPTDEQRRAMGLIEAPVCGKANTLIFANVMGFHRRGEFLEGRRREQIQFTFGDRPASRRVEQDPRT